MTHRNNVAMAEPNNDFSIVVRSSGLLHGFPVSSLVSMAALVMDSLSCACGVSTQETTSQTTFSLSLLLTTERLRLLPLRTVDNIPSGDTVFKTGVML